jgi:DNA-directed RNA polymerase specialized sigma24 family protein
MKTIIQSTELTDDQKSALDAQMMASNAVLAAVAISWWGEPSVRRLREEFLAGNHFRLSDTAIEAMVTMTDLEPIVLSAYLGIQIELANAFYWTNLKSRPQLDEEDYGQEASLAVIDAMYCFDGSTKFCTYVYRAIKNRLVAFVRDNETHARVGRGIKKMRERVRVLMRDKQCDFEKAISYLRKEMAKEGKKLSGTAVKKITASMYKIQHNISESVPQHVSTEREEAEQLVTEVVEQANLVGLERELVEAYLAGEQGFQAKFTLQVNPNTGRLYTRQAVNQTWKRVCVKLRELVEARQAA